MLYSAFFLGHGRNGDQPENSQYQGRGDEDGFVQNISPLMF